MSLFGFNHQYLLLLSLTSMSPAARWVHSARWCFYSWGGRGACGSVWRTREVNLGDSIPWLQGGGKLLTHRNCWLEIMKRIVIQVCWLNVNICLSQILHRDVSKLIFLQGSFQQILLVDDCVAASVRRRQCGRWRRHGYLWPQLVVFPIHQWDETIQQVCSK